MGKISQRELDYIKSTISSEQLIDLVSLKAKMNKRKLKLGKSVNESLKLNESYSDDFSETGFCEFYDNLDDRNKNLFREVFGIFLHDNAGSSIQGKIYSLFQNFLSNADRYITDKTE